MNGKIVCMPGSCAGSQDETLIQNLNFMKQDRLNIHALEGFSELDRDELKAVNGGSLWDDFVYIANMTARCFREFTRTASEFQASLPSSLKK